MDLGSDAFALRKRFQLPLHVQFWRAARSSPFTWRRLCMADSTGQELTWGRSLAGALMLSRWMDRRCRGQKMVGMMMPASVGAALMNAATLISGRVPVNLNFTGARASIGVAIRRCGLKTVFTSRALLQRTGLPERPEYVYLEDVMRRMPRRDQVLCYLLAAITPNALAERRLMRRGAMDDLATVMFTSGATGEPKGVMLSHHNIVSNIEAFSEVLRFGPSDTMMGVLPPFHSFGFTATLWAPLTQRMRVVYHPNPLDAKGVGRMAAKYRATVIAGTSSFFALYARGCEPEQFRSLRLAVAGAQKLVPAVAEAFEARFGLPLTEGYGCTELSPVVAVNVPDVTRRRGEADRRARRLGRPAAAGTGNPRRGPRDAPAGGRRRAGRRPRPRAERDAALHGRRARHRGGVPRGPASAGAGAAAARLVRDGGHRRDGRGRVPLHPRPRLAVQQDRRRDGAAHGDRGRARRGLDGEPSAASPW